MNDELDIRHFGNYDLVRRIDIGGMGEVYLAHQRTAFGREVAVKIIRSDLVHDITARKRFLREAEVNAYLKHDYILSLVEFGEEQGRLFLVSPYIKGGNLGARLQKGPISLSEVKQLFTALVQAVSYLHKRGVIHRDLKPSNILLDHEEDSGLDTVRLIDFGIAALLGMPENASLTMTGHEVGTVAYMAPERANGIAAPSNDIYSLGVLLYQMLTGRVPSAQDMVPLPQPLERVIRQCTAFDPDDRFATADELLSAFEQATQSLTGKKLPTVVESPPVAQAPIIVEDDQTDVPPAVTYTPPSARKPRSGVEAVPAAIDNRPAYAPAQPVRSTQTQNIPLHNSVDSPSSFSSSSEGSEIRLSPFPNNRMTFSGDDYNAPTTYLDPNHAHLPQTATRSYKQSKRVKRTHPKGSLVVLVAAFIMIIILVMSGLVYLITQAAITASVTISPRVQMISSAFTVVAKPGLIRIDAASSSIPASALTSKQTVSQQGSTSGIANCYLGVFNCKQAVSLSDVNNLSYQLRKTADGQIDQDLQKQLGAGKFTAVGHTVYQDVSIVPDPPIGTVSPTVTVSLVEEGSLEYIKTQDVHDLAMLLLKNKLSPGYTLIDSLTQIGQPVVQSVAANGQVTIAVAAGSVERYQITPAELTDIQHHLTGKDQKQAHALIATHPNLDQSVVVIHITYGDTIPASAGQIKMLTVNPTNLPAVQLPPLPTPVATPKPTT